MSATAIAQVTAALKGLLKANLDSAVSVTLLQPSDTLNANSLNLYLYRVTENAQLKNTDWRGDRTRPPANFPALALELYYLLTPFANPPDSGADTLPQAHTLLGTAMQIFHAHPTLNDVHMPGFDFETFPGLNDLRNAFDRLIVRLQPTSTEELSKIWSMFNQPYRLSVVYHVSLVQIAPMTPSPARAAPVMVTGLEVFTADPPRLTALEPARGGTGGLLTLRGFDLARKSFISRVRFGGQPVEPANVSERQMQITIPIDLEAGPEQEVRVLLDEQASNPLIYVVSPWLRRVQPLRGAPGPGPTPPVPLTLEVIGEDLEAAAAISVTLGGNALAHTVLDKTHLQVTAPTGQPNGLYPVRVTVDGRASNTRTFEIIPLIDQLVPPAPSVGNPLRIRGRRLDGAQVRVHFGPSAVVIGANASATQVQVPRVPRLDPGTYELRVNVDGRDSNPLSFTVA